MNSQASDSTEDPATKAPLLDFDRRFKNSLESFLRWGLIARLLLAAVIAYFGVKTLALAFLCGAAVYLVLNLILRRLDFLKASIFILCLEWTALCALSFIHFGTNAGIHMLVMLLAFVVLNLDMFGPRIRMIMVALPVSGAWFIHPLFAAHPPLVPLTKIAETVLTIGNITVFSYLVARILLFFHRTRENEKLAISRIADARMRLVGDLSHEIKTPLSAILTAVQGTLRREHTIAEYQSALQLCERNTRYLAHLSRRMLDLLRADSGHLESEWIDLDPRDVLLEVVATHQPLAEAKGVALEVDCPEGHVISTDADKLRIIVGNLLNNAIRHSREGQAIRLRCSHEADGSGFSCQVADSGSGISAGDLPHIFEPFYRADKSRTRKEPTFGLGLAIADAMARSMRGRIEVQSELAKGSVFTVIIPTHRIESVQ